MDFKIAVIEGDGIGPEIVHGALTVMDAVGKRFGHSFSYTNVLMGGCAIDKHGIPLPDETVEICKKSDAVLLGAVGGPKWDTLPGHLRPEKGLLGIRKALGLYANIRPAVLFESLINACPLRDEIAKQGIDLVIVRELTGGIYFGDRGYRQGEYGEEAFDTERYSKLEVERIARIGFEMAMKRRKKLTSIDKANVLESSRLWRKTAEEVAKQYPEVQFENMLVDSASMQLVRCPSQFDVVIASNMFGDILSDEAAQITGSLGMLPSSSLGDGKLGLYEPIHGSAPDIAGRDIANPIATILSAAMLLRASLGLEDEAIAVERAVDTVLKNGYATGDIKAVGSTVVGCKEISRLISEAVKR